MHDKFREMSKPELCFVLGSLMADKSYDYCYAVFTALPFNDDDRYYAHIFTAKEGQDRAYPAVSVAMNKQQIVDWLPEPFFKQVDNFKNLPYDAYCYWIPSHLEATND